MPSKKHSEYSIFLNNDTTVDPSFVEPLIAQLESDKDTILVAPKIFYAQSEDINMVCWREGKSSFCIHFSLWYSLKKY